MIIVLADDFSGAAEIAGAGHRRGLKAEVCLECPLKPRGGLLVIDTNTRSAPRAYAVQRLRAAAAELRRVFPEPIRVYKKIDSVLRGHVAAEVTALMQGVGSPSCLIVAGNPASGRTIVGGTLLIDGVPIDQTDFAFDPEHPIVRSRVLDLLDFGDVPDEMSESPDTFRDRISAPDVQSTQDLIACARSLAPGTLPVGGAAFFNALLDVWNLPAAASVDAPDLKGTTLVVCGSACESSRVNVDLWERGGLGVSRIPAALFSRDAPGCLDAWTDATSLLLRERRLAIMTCSPEPGTTTCSDKAYRAGQARRLAGLMAEAASRVAERVRPAHLLVEGGSTASALLRRIGWQALNVTHEHAPGVVSLRPSEYPQVIVTVKPGSYPWPGHLSPAPNCRSGIS